MAIGADMRTGPFQYGDRVQMTSQKKKMYTIDLTPGERFNTDKGYILHDDLVGKEEGTILENTSGVLYMALRPLLSDYVLSMPRGATVIYPKDAGQIITMGDIYPGARVVEAGVGTGALTLSLLRAVGEEGKVFSFELRDEFATIASANIKNFFGEEHPAWSLTMGDLAEELNKAVEDGSIDRIVLDMLAPWDCIEACLKALRPGGVLIVYVATVTQLSRVVEQMRSTEQFTEPVSTESMVRGWHVDGLAVRPDHRMVAHTAFLVQARKLADGFTPLPKKKRQSKTEYSEEDVSAWTPDAVGILGASDRKLRKLVRKIEREETETKEAGNGIEENTSRD